MSWQPVSDPNAPLSALDELACDPSGTPCPRPARALHPGPLGPGPLCAGPFGVGPFGSSSRRALHPRPGVVASRIHDIIQQNPGIHFRELGRLAALTSTGQLRHHVDRLHRRGLVSEVADGRYRRYFPASHAADLQPQLARLSRPLPRRIVRTLLDAPMSRTYLRRRLGCADSTLGYHLQRMLLQGDLHQQRDHRGSQYVVSDPERVRRILQAQEGTVPKTGFVGLLLENQSAPIAPTTFGIVDASHEVHGAEAAFGTPPYATPEGQADQPGEGNGLSATDAAHMTQGPSSTATDAAQS